MDFKNARHWVMLAALASCMATPAMAQNIAVVNGTPIPSSRADTMMAEVARQSQGKPLPPDLRNQVREELINREILMQQAQSQGIPSRPDVQAQLALADQGVIIQALMLDYAKTHKPSDADLKARYDAAVAQVGGKEYHLHHILVDSEQQARDLIAKIKAGGSFEDLAKQYSKDPGSGKNGGDLDWANPKNYVPEFADAATKLKPGQMTDTPVHTQFGWHIIRLDGVRDAPVPPFDQVKDQIAQQVQQEQLQAYVKGLRDKAKVQ
jgi:peptidyl-prolyl cis-trans isomerase C